MHYSRLEFAMELKKRVKEQQSCQEIGRWAHAIFIDYLHSQRDNDFLPILLTVNNMEVGPEYVMSYRRLNDIANGVIRGKLDILSKPAID
jgi:hypothetical protein